MSIRTILATSALATMLAVGAHAQTATDPVAPAAPGTMAPATEPMVPGATDGMAPAAPADTLTLDQPAEGYSPVDLAAVSTEQLIGANIVNHADETIASVDDVLITDSGQVDGIVAKFGGFLGFGTNLVKLSVDEVQVMQDANGTMVLRSALTPEQIEARPEFVKEG